MAVVLVFHGLGAAMLLPHRNEINAQYIKIMYKFIHPCETFMRGEIVYINDKDRDGSVMMEVSRKKDRMYNQEIHRFQKFR